MPQRFVSSTRSYSSPLGLGDRLEQADAGVVAEDVDTPEAATVAAVDEPLAVALVADVGRQRTSTLRPCDGERSRERLALRLRSRCAADDRGALGGEALDDRAADAAARSP